MECAHPPPYRCRRPCTAATKTATPPYTTPFLHSSSLQAGIFLYPLLKLVVGHHGDEPLVVAEHGVDAALEHQRHARAYSPLEAVAEKAGAGHNRGPYIGNRRLQYLSQEGELRGEVSGHAAAHEAGVFGDHFYDLNVAGAVSHAVPVVVFLDEQKTHARASREKVGGR